MNKPITWMFVAALAVTAAPAFAEDTGTTGDTTTTVDDEATSPGEAVSEAAKGLKDVDGPRKDEAKKLKDTALANNPGYQKAVATRNAKANKDDDGDDETADHPGKDDNPGMEHAADRDDHPGSDDLPDHADDHADRPHGKSGI